MRVELGVAGVGGQGVLVAGSIIGRAAVVEGLYAAQSSTYGAEVRGTPSLSEVVISDEPIEYPFASRLDALILMSSRALKAIRRLKPRGLLIVDDSVELQRPLPAQVRVVSLPAFKEAEARLGRALLGNLVLVGALSRITGLPRIKALERAVRAELPEARARVGEGSALKAVRLGFELGGRFLEDSGGC